MFGTAQNVLRMLDKRTYINLFALIAYTGLFNLYLYELFYGSWNIANVKGFYYLITILTLLWGIIDRKIKNSTETSNHINLITEITVIINFVFIILNLYDLLFIPLLNFFLYNGSVLVVSVIVLIASTKHEIFKN